MINLSDIEPEKLSDKEACEQLLTKGAEGEKVLVYLMKKHQKSIKRTIKESYPRLYTEDFFKDSYQEAACDLWRNACPEVITSLKKFFTTICKRRFIDRIRIEKPGTKAAITEAPQEIIQGDILNKISANDFYKVVSVLLTKIIDNENQISVLMLRAKRYSYSDILSLVPAYNTEQACRNAHKRAMKKLVEYWLNNPSEKLTIEKYFNFLAKSET